MLCILFSQPIPVAALLGFRNCNLHDSFSKHLQAAFAKEEEHQMLLPALTLLAESDIWME